MGICPVCQGNAFRETEWQRTLRVSWPAAECLTCGAITLRKNLEAERSKLCSESGVRRLEPGLVIAQPPVRRFG
jgi:hypothetical protein